MGRKQSVRRRKNVRRDFVVEADNIDDWIVVGLLLGCGWRRRRGDSQKRSGEAPLSAGTSVKVESFMPDAEVVKNLSESRRTV